MVQSSHLKSKLSLRVIDDAREPNAVRLAKRPLPLYR